MYCTNRDCPDFISTGIHGEYRDGITQCPYCGEQLADSPSEPPAVIDPGQTDSKPASTWGAYDPPEAGQVQDDLEPVFETSDPSEVPVVRSFLDANGIPHVLVGGETFDAFRGSLSPFRFNPKAGIIGFLVPAAYAEIARELLVEIESEE